MAEAAALEIQLKTRISEDPEILASLHWLQEAPGAASLSTGFSVCKMKDNCALLWNDEPMVQRVFEVSRPDEAVHVTACAHPSSVSLI